MFFISINVRTCSPASQVCDKGNANNQRGLCKFATEWKEKPIGNRIQRYKWPVYNEDTSSYAKKEGFVIFTNQGPVSRKSRKLLGPFARLQPAYSVKLVLLYVAKGIRMKITLKFRASRRLLNCVTRNASEKFRDCQETGPRPLLTCSSRDITEVAVFASSWGVATIRYVKPRSVKISFGWFGRSIVYLISFFKLLCLRKCNYSITEAFTVNRIMLWICVFGGPKM